MVTRTLFVMFLPALAACLASSMAPLVAPQQPRTRVLIQREFRLGTLDFGRAAGDSHELSTVIPAMLLTELRDEGRFSVYEGGGIRTGSRLGGSAGNNLQENPKSLPLNEENARQYVDGYLSGTVTTLSAQQACLDLRLSNAVTHEVLYARAVCVPVAGDGRVDRTAVKRIAEEVARAIKQVANGKVTSADGRLVFCDKGTQAGVSRGMVAYIVATGDTVSDAAVHGEVQRYTGVDPAQLATVAAPVIIGEMYVVSVEDKYSVGYLYQGSYALPGDTVFFK